MTDLVGHTIEHGSQIRQFINDAKDRLPDVVAGNAVSQGERKVERT